MTNGNINENARYLGVIFKLFYQPEQAVTGGVLKRIAGGIVPHGDALAYPLRRSAVDLHVKPDYRVLFWFNGSERNSRGDGIRSVGNPCPRRKAFGKRGGIKTWLVVKVDPVLAVVAVPKIGQLEVAFVKEYFNGVLFMKSRVCLVQFGVVYGNQRVKVTLVPERAGGCPCALPCHDVPVNGDFRRVPPRGVIRVQRRAAVPGVRLPCFLEKAMFVFRKKGRRIQGAEKGRLGLKLAVEQGRA